MVCNVHTRNAMKLLSASGSCGVPRREQQEMMKKAGYIGLLNKMSGELEFTELISFYGYDDGKPLSPSKLALQSESLKTLLSLADKTDLELKNITEDIEDERTTEGFSKLQLISTIQSLRANKLIKNNVNSLIDFVRKMNIDYIKKSNSIANTVSSRKKTFLARGLQNVLDGNGNSFGNYLFESRWDGYSNIVKIYKTENVGEQNYSNQIAEWDSHDQEVKVSEKSLMNQPREIAKLVQAIRSNRYSVERMIVTDRHQVSDNIRDADVAAEMQEEHDAEVNKMLEHIKTNLLISS